MRAWRTGPRRRRSFAVVAAITLAAATALAGCTAGSGTTSKADSSITLSAPWEVTYGENWNPFTAVALGGEGGGGGPGLGWVYEELVRTRLGDGTVVPWLAKSWDFSNGGKTVTFHLQPKATWSNGKPVTADDVVYSLGVPLKYPELNPIGVKYKTVTKIDEKTVQVTWDEPAYSHLVDLYYPTMIVPVSIWGSKDPRTFIDKKPVGSGPATVKTFSPQQVTFNLRTDYWGGTFPMKTMRWTVSSASSSQGLISNGSLDATCCIANYTQFINSDPKHHVLYMQPDGSESALVFNTAKGPFADVNLRHAIADSVAIEQIRKLGEAKSPRTFPPASISGLSPDVFGKVISPKYKTRPPGANPTAAKADLAAGGYTVSNGKLIKDGKVVPLELLVNVADTNFGDAKSFGALLVQQFKQSIGVDVTITPLPDDQFSEQTKEGKFDMYVGSNAFGSGRGIYWSYRNLTSDFLAPIGKEADANYGRFNDATFNSLVAAYANTGDAAEQTKIAGQIQDEFVAQMPAVPLISGGGQLVLNTTHWTGWPTDDNLDHVPSIGNGQDFIMTMLQLKPAK